MTTYYVSSQVGSNNNAGTSESAPLASLQTAANLVKPGDTVEVMNGTYTAPFYGDALDITTSGTASAPITFEAAPGQTPVIDSSGGWKAIDIEASYITVKGFTVVGDAASYNLASATAGYSAGNSNLDGNGIMVSPTGSVPLPNHIIIEDNTVSNEPGGGIGTQGADYVQILNNTVHNNGNWSAFGCSGISVWTSANLDTKAGAHTIISGNVVYDNAQLVPTNGYGEITDGEGIILDTNPNYTGEILVENNTVYGNGSSGIESFLTNGATITGNTVYGNNTNSVMPASYAEILINSSTNDTVTNNITTAPGASGSGASGSATAVAAPTISKAAANSNGSVTLTGTAKAGSTVTVWSTTGTKDGATTASSSGAWSFTTATLAPGVYGFTATDTTSAGTSAKSSALDVTVKAAAVAAPVLSKAAANSNDSVTLTGTAKAGSTVTVWSTTGTKDGATTASSSGAWSFTTATLTPGVYGFTATDTTSAGTSAKSSALDVTVKAAAVAAPVLSKAAVNSNDTVTLAGTAKAGSTVTVWSTTGTKDGATTASSSGAWSFTTATLAPGVYGFAATDTTSAGTSAKSSALGVTVKAATQGASTVAVATRASAATAPALSKATVNSNDSVTLTGTAKPGSTVTVWSTTGTKDGTAKASSAGAWSFTTPHLLPGVYGYAATDTTSAGTSQKSSALGVTVEAAAAESSALASAHALGAILSSIDGSGTAALSHPVAARSASAVPTLASTTHVLAG